ncbi:MAG: MFS transporter [Pyrinomonadaceae bacterium]|nr:MFS transporter [Pyrinomonadaceae bacterium]
MSFGFLGIQFGWGLQLANMSAIYTYLGANPDDVPLLWLAGPVTGLLVQPIIGSMSDRTWNRLGRRRPYFLVGAILASIALFIMPSAGEIARSFGGRVITGVAMAATMLWILDASINVSMEPFRAFVADKLNASQRTAGFVMQSFFIGIGASLASALPYLFTWLGVTGRTASGVPLSVQYSFKIGAIAFFGAVLYTVLTTREYPPEDMEDFNRMRREKRGITAGFTEIFSALRNIPTTMKQLAVVQFFTWLGLFCMWMFFGLMTSYHIFRAPDSNSPLFREGNEWGGIAFMVYNIVTFAVAFALPKLAAATSRKHTHALALLCGGLGLLSTYFIADKNVLLLTMIGVGIAWASILSLPYAILAGALPPARMGVFMGIFNFFIVIPEIVASLTFGRIIRRLFGEGSTLAPLYVVMAGGVFLIIAAVACLMLVRDVGDVPERAVIKGDEKEPVLVQQSVQPVPSAGLNE